jgi:hypothetical protein
VSGIKEPYWAAAAVEGLNHPGFTPSTALLRLRSYDGPLDGGEISLRVRLWSTTCRFVIDAWGGKSARPPTTRPDEPAKCI